MNGRARAGLLLLVDLVAPAGLYYLLRAAGLGETAALLTCSLMPGAGMTLTFVRERRLDPVGLFMTGVTLAGAGLTLVTGSPRLILLKGALLMAVFGGWFLYSARGGDPVHGPRPMAMRLSRPLLEGWAVARWRPWDELWEHSPLFRRIWRVSTIIWGAGALADAAVRAVIAFALPVDLAVGLNGGLYALYSVLMLVIVNVYQARAGLFDRRVYASAAPE
ncbi:VC0807 family protein [Streptosporangium sandarakinum]